MVGFGLKKLARENGMFIANGVAYGSLKGFNATMSEGPDYKKIVFSTNFRDPAMKGAFATCLEKLDLNKQYRVTGIQYSETAIAVIFHDTIGTMKKIRAFVDFFTELLAKHYATPCNVCLACGDEITQGIWVMVDGKCMYVHDACGEKIRATVENDNAEIDDARTGSYISGALGAFVGAAAGAVVWALVLLMGYVASVVGFLIGWLAQFGYNFFKGKSGKAKVLILVLAIVFGVVLGTFAADALQLAEMINNGELLPQYTYSDIPSMILETLEDDAEYSANVMSNVTIGLLFAALGVIPMLRKTSDSVAGRKFRKM